ncbi:MAG TPA: heavy metal translocating P-type ATPase, partial [Geminicoccaceae bacterium]|nr:heavy metal translocating P-type ATPase [Geminicoccaceae bacterium]
AEPGVVAARVNLTTRRLAVTWRGAVPLGEALVGTLARLGYRATPYDPSQLASGDAQAERRLLRAMAVAGFAAGNIMLLSVSVWSGQVYEMGGATRALLHWFSALIALPAVVYAGRPFFASALGALRAGHTNMDVPISLGVLLATGMSLFETIRGGAHVYFDSAVMLLFFLLIGRYLDLRARGKARAAAERLLALGTEPITVLAADGRSQVLPAERVAPGMTVLVAVGERIGIDGRVLSGRSEVDSSLITGETLPQTVGPGDPVFAGTLNVAAPLRLEATAVGGRTLLAEVVRLREAAEQRRARYVVLADRVARLYAPAVHGLALATFLGWTLLAGIAWQTALLYAVAVLIITCPCALGLAVPAVQVIASGRLLGKGVLLKSATALERLATVDTVVLDKTGTLTLGRPSLDHRMPVDRADLELAASLAGASRHPLASALCRAAPGVPVANGVEEIAGRGLRRATSEGEVRLGSRAWCNVAQGDGETGGPELWLVRPGQAPVCFAFADPLRPDAGLVIGELRRRGLAIELLSGDRAPTVARVAGALDIADWRFACTPAEKAARLEELADAGRRVLMVGDGLNDAPALAGAHVSLSPASALDISQNAADAVFQGERLRPVVEVVDVARRAARLIRQNLGLALAYNALVVPLAMLGMVTPLVAALCMSASSLLVVGNSLRLRGRS